MLKPFDLILLRETVTSQNEVTTVEGNNSTDILNRKRKKKYSNYSQ